jgi:hypothetical protein
VTRGLGKSGGTVGQIGKALRHCWQWHNLMIMNNDAVGNKALWMELNLIYSQNLILIRKFELPQNLQIPPILADDDMADRLHYYYTTTFLLVTSVLISLKMYGGRPIEVQNWGKIVPKIKYFF